MFAWGAEHMARHFGAAAFELRYDVFGRCAVRVAGGGVLDRHVEPVPTAPWTARARCGVAVGWVAAAAPPDDPDRVEALLRDVVARRTAFVRERQATTLAALDADLIERLTHRLRTDVMTLSAVAEAGLEGLFGDPPAEVLDEIRRTSAEAQRRITAAREVMTALAAGAGDARPEPIAATLRAELDGAGRSPDAVTVAGDEEPWAAIGGPGWSACARILAGDRSWHTVTIAPDPGGWAVTLDAAAAEAGDVPVAWSDRALGELARAGHIVVAAGGHATAERRPDGSVRVTLTVPAAPSSG